MVYRNSEVPEELHYKYKNSPPIRVLAEPGTIIVPSDENIQQPSYNKSFSGYNPKEPDMRGIFVAKGPGLYLILLSLV